MTLAESCPFVSTLTTAAVIQRTEQHPLLTHLALTYHKTLVSRGRLAPQFKVIKLQESGAVTFQHTVRTAEESRHAGVWF